MPGLARVYQMMESPIKGYRAQTQIQPLLWQIRLRVLKMNVSSFFSYFFVVLSMFGKLKKLYRLLQVPQPPPNEPNGLLSYFAENPPVDEEIDIDAALNDQSLDDMMDQEPHSYPDQYDGKVKVNSHAMPNQDAPASVRPE